MKNFFKSLAICALAALTFASCQKENADGNMDDQSSVVSINLTSPLMGTKAFADGNTVNVVHVHVYKVGENGALTYIEPGQSTAVTPSQNVTMTNGSATYSTRLVTGQTYTFVFWADYIDNNGNSHYTYTPATQTIAVNYDNAVGNDETRDAFYAVLENVKITGAYSKSVTLTRPFAQVNFGVTTADYDAAVAAGVTVNGAAVKCTKAANAINLLNGTTSGEVDATFATATLPSETLTAANTSYKYVAMNYVLVGKDAKTLSDITLTLNATGAASGIPEYTYTNIPLQGNYRTNIVGNLFTSPASIDITVDKNFKEGDNNVVIQNVSSIAAANEALTSGATNINISNITASEASHTPLQMPATLESITISIESIESTANLTIEQPTSGSNPASVAVTIPSTASVNQLTINLPESHVEINGASYTSINATTSNNTLVIGKDVTVETLTIEAGAVEIYGNVGTLVNDNNQDIKVWAVADAATWSKAYAAGAKKIELKADINAEVTTTLYVPKDGIVDGKGKTVSGDISLYVNAVGGTIQNMNFKEIHNAANKLSAVYASELTGKLVITGCTFDTFDWDAIQTTPQAGAEIEITGNTFKYNGTPSGNNRRYVHIQSAKNVDFSAKVTGNSFLNNVQLLMSALEVYYFIDNNKIELNGNYFDSPAKVCILSGYGSVATDVLKNMKIKTSQGEEVNLAAYIDINGDQRIFTDLNDALSTVQAGQTVSILKAGEYSVQTLSGANYTIDAKVEGVVFKHTPGSGAWIANCTETVTVKNLTWDVGIANYQYFQNVNLEKCTIKGMPFGHTANSFKDCTFEIDSPEAYNIWTYSSNITFEDCVFNCAGKSVLVYKEQGTTPCVVTLKNCTFNASQPVEGKAAIEIDSSLNPYEVHITNCSATGFAEGTKSGNSLWNNKKGDAKNLKVVVDGIEQSL
ncbi:MAG: DUF6562 domain-containing protein [Candidatus Egerieousia sp.]|nr:DUF6562 domain-containing protein [Candidatus Egerieousia sp.]